MACMDHDCGACGYFWMDNSVAVFCPKCGAAAPSNHFDEEPDREYDYEPAYDDEDWT